MRVKGKEQNPQKLKKQPGARPKTTGRRSGKRKQEHLFFPESNLWFRALADLTPDAVFIFDDSGKVHYWNDGATRMFGYTKREMIGNSAYLLIPERYKQQNKAALDKLLAGGSPEQFNNTFETHCLKKDGTEIFVQYSNAVWEKGGTFFIGSIIRDVSGRRQEEESLHQSREQLEELVGRRTAELLRINEKLEREIRDRRQAEELLRRSENRYRAVFENTGTAMIIVGEDTIITMVNAEAEKLSGYTRSEIEGRKSWKEFVHPDDLAQMLQFHQKRGRDPSSVPKSYEYRLVDRFGQVKNIYQTVTVIPGTNLRISSLVDISGRKQAEEERIRLTAIIESTNDLVATARLDYSLMYMNRAGRRMLGWDEYGVLTGKSIADVHPPWAQEIILKQAVPAALNEGLWSGETAVIGPDGKEIPVSHLIMAHASGDEEARFFSSVIRDISAFKKAELAMRESEERYRSVVETATDAIITVNGRGAVTSWNQGAERLYGYAKDEAIGRPYTLIMPPRFQDMHGRILNRVLEGEIKAMQAPVEGTGMRSDGSEFPMETSITTWEAGGEKFLTAIIRDITDRKRTDEERIRLITAVEQATESIIIMSPDGKVLYANPATALQSGYSVDELIGKNSFEPKVNGYDRAYFRGIFEALQQGKIWTGRLAFTKKDGSLINLEQTLSPIYDAAGHIINLLSINRDISKEVKLEEQLRQSQKMEAIGTLAGGIAHDFNNILAAIMGYTEMSLYQTSDESPVKQHLSLILKSAIRARDLVRQILAFSRKGEEERKPLHIHAIVKEAVKLLRASIPATIEIHEDIDASAGIVIADPTQIHQVIVNLCTNAAQAMQKRGGLLTIGLAPVELTADDIKTYADLSPGSYVQLDVSDTGTGIDPQIISRIFDPFFTTKEIGRGTGMGLAVVHGIVKSYKGAISVQSQPGQGSSFRVLLPRIQEAAHVEHDDVSPLPRGSERILFIDDEELLVHISKEMLETLGYSVVALQSSVEALDLFEHNPQGFDLVITDQAMPQITGYELAQKFIAIRPDIPIMLCTGYSETVSEEHALAAGIQGFVMKPIKLQDFANRIRTVLDREATKLN